MNAFRLYIWPVPSVFIYIVACDSGLCLNPLAGAYNLAPAPRECMAAWAEMQRLRLPWGDQLTLSLGPKVWKVYPLFRPLGFGSMSPYPATVILKMQHASQHSCFLFPSKQLFFLQLRKHTIYSFTFLLCH